MFQDWDGFLPATLRSVKIENFPKIRKQGGQAEL